MKANDNYQRDLTSRSVFSCRPLAFCRKAGARIDRVKAAILSEFRGALEGRVQLLRLALNEAEALAWASGYPHLLFPALATEKAQAIANWHTRQQALRPTRAVS